MGKLFRALPRTHGKDTVALQRALDYLHSVGVTAFLDPHIGETGKGMENPDLETYAQLSRGGGLTAHVAGVVMASGNVDPDSQISTVKALQKKYSGLTNLSLIGFKIFADGVVEFPTQTAAMSKPYKNSGYLGDLLYDPKKFKDFVIKADKAGLVVHTHAIGDRAVTETLDAIEAARRANGPKGPLHSITHLQFVLPDDIPRFKLLNVPASVQLLWAFGDETTIDIVQPYIDPYIYKWQYPAQSMLQAGALLCGASDWPVSSANPFEAISRAETRKGGKGVLDPAQRVDRKEMFRAYSAHAAILMGIQDRAGMLKPGLSADLIVVDRDVWTVDPESLWNTRVLLTLFEGKVVYKAKKD